MAVRESVDMHNLHIVNELIRVNRFWWRILYKKYTEECLIYHLLFAQQGSPSSIKLFFVFVLCQRAVYEIVLNNFKAKFIAQLEYLYFNPFHSSNRQFIKGN